MGDIVGKFEKLELVVISVVAGYLIWRYRARILALLTGDDRIHTDAFDGIWFAFFRCFGTCTGDWSRCISCCPCWSACDLQHQNLVDAFGRWSGLLQWEIRVTNITVGDLPVDNAGYFFVSFEVGEDLPFHTAVTQLAQPKLVQFHGECTIKVRDASFDNDVRIIIKEMKTLGSPAICEVYVRPNYIIDWASKPGGSTMRLEMKPCNGALSILPAWLLVTCELARPWEDESSSPWSQAAITLTRSTGQDESFKNIRDLKSAFPLMNGHGIEVREADEKDAAHFQSLMRRHRWGMKFCRLVIILFIVAALLFRTAVTSCYRSYKRVKVLHEHGVEFPATVRTSHWVLQRCGYDSEVSLADHKGVFLQDFEDWKELLSDNNWQEYTQYLANGDTLEDHPPEPVQPDFAEFGGEQRLKVDPNSTACMPRRRDVIRMCYNMPIGASQPTFLRGIFRCRAWTCRYRMLLVPISLVVVICLVVVISITYCCYRSNLRQMRAMHRKLVVEAQLHSNSPGHESFHEDSFGCCGCGGRSPARQTQGFAPAPALPYHAGLGRGPSSGGILPQE